MLSIITVTKNSEDTLERCMESVQSQGLPGYYEHIIVDGGSVDSTVEIASKYTNKIINQEGLGIYPAMNQGASVASQDFILFLNSDDWLDQKAFQIINQEIKNFPAYDAYLFSVKMVKGEESKVWDVNKTINDEFRMPAPHPGVLVRKNVFDSIGGFDCKYKYCADYAFLLKLIHGVRYKTSDSVISNFSLGGASSNSLAIFESHLVRLDHGVSILNIIFGYLYDIKRKFWV